MLSIEAPKRQEAGPVKNQALPGGIGRAGVNGDKAKITVSFDSMGFGVVNGNHR